MSNGTPALQPRRVRWRLTVAFVAVAAIAAGVLAGGSHALVREDRLASFTARSLEKAGLALSLAQSRIGIDASDADIEELIATLDRRAGIVAIALFEGETLGSGPTDEAPYIPSELFEENEEDGFQRLRVDIDGTPYLIVHPVEDPEPAQLVFFFSMRSLSDQLDRLAGILWQLWVTVALVAALIGNVLARRTLRPVARASKAATDLAEGILDTRLPIDRSDEFGSWAISFNRMADALQEKIYQLTEAARREKRFTSDVAHELRTPLSTLVTAASLLRDRFDRMDPDARWAAEKILAEVARLRKLVEDLLEMSRLDAGRESLVLTRIGLEDVIHRLLGHRGWSQRVEIDVPEIDLNTDVRRFDRVLGNLVANALEHGDGLVAIRGLAGNGEVLIEVSDQGPGIDPRLLPHVFDRFFKGDPARGGGSGLGLAIAQENARMLGGEIGVESIPAGTTFTVRLPRDPEAPL